MPRMGGNFKGICEQLESWYQKPAGQYLLKQEQGLVSELLDQVFGYHLLQFGPTRDHALGACTSLNHKILASERSGLRVGLQCDAVELPFTNDSIDVVILHHALEFSENPHALLREAHRVLAPQGHMVVLGFNPASLFGLGLTVRGLLPRSLWRSARGIGSQRLRDWLHLLGSDVQTVRHTYTVPPLGGAKTFRTLSRCDEFLTRYNVPLGGVYAMHAQKHVAALTPLRDRWRKRVGSRLIGLATPKPVPSPRDGDAAA